MQNIERSNNNKLVTKVFQRGLEMIKTRSAYIEDKLYYRDWTIREHGKKKVIKQTYNAGHPIKGSKCILNIIA